MGGAKALYIFYGVIAIAIIELSMVKTKWRTTWGMVAGGII